MFSIPDIDLNLTLNALNQEVLEAPTWMTPRLDLPEPEQLPPDIYRETCEKLALSLCRGIILIGGNVDEAESNKAESVDEIIFIDTSSGGNLRFYVHLKETPRMEVELEDELVLTLQEDGEDQWTINTVNTTDATLLDVSIVLQKIGARLYAELLTNSGQLRAWDVLGRHRFFLWITLEAFASFDALKEEAGNCEEHCRAFLDPISLEKQRNGCCINNQCYDGSRLTEWYRAHPDLFGHGSIPHSRSLRTPEEFLELCRLTRLFRTGIRDSITPPNILPENENQHSADE